METSEGHLGGHIIGRPAPGTWCPAVWDWLMTEHRIRSVLDVGCGPGYVMEYFHRAGCEVFGVDGSPSGVRDHVLPRYVLQHDFSTGAWGPARTFDLVWSSEFLEHVEERFLTNCLPAFQAATGLLVVTYAVPGQGGHHHVNENSESYWAGRFEEAGYEIDHLLTRRARSLIPPEGQEGKQFRGKGLILRPVG